MLAYYYKSKKSYRSWSPVEIDPSGGVVVVKSLVLEYRFKAIRDIEILFVSRVGVVVVVY